MAMIQYTTEHLEVDYAKKLAKELRASGKYKVVKLGSYLKERGKSYCKIYVDRK
jgi:hypothetical protein